MFIDRLVNSDSKDFYNDNRHACAAFQHDWLKVSRRQRFRKFLSHVGCKQQPVEMTEMKEALAKHYSLLCDVFTKCVHAEYVASASVSYSHASPPRAPCRASSGTGRWELGAATHSAWD